MSANMDSGLAASRQSGMTPMESHPRLEQAQTFARSVLGFALLNPGYAWALIRGRRLHSRQPVLVVDVLAELRHAVAARPGGDVDPVQRHGLGHLRVLALAGFDDAVD